jgi:hypothetical protein
MPKKVEGYPCASCAHIPGAVGAGERKERPLLRTAKGVNPGASHCAAPLAVEAGETGHGGNSDQPMYLSRRGKVRAR